MFFMSVEGFASTYHYSCKSLDDNAPYGIEKLTLDLDAPMIRVAFADFYVKSALYELNARYAPKAASMKKFAQFKLTDVESGSFPDDQIGEIFVEKQLQAGGYLLKIGKQGGFIKMSGSHYSWANYLCWR